MASLITGQRLGGVAWLAATGAVGLLLVAAGTARSDNQDTHGRDAVPDYARVFNQDQVGRLDVRIALSDWQAVLDDMQNMAGRSGFGLNVPFSDDQFAACAGKVVELAKQKKVGRELPTEWFLQDIRD